MAELIPVGTLCIVVGPFANKEHLGAYCTVTGYIKPGDISYDYGDIYWIVFADKRTNPVNGKLWTAAHGTLHPLYPPEVPSTTRKDKDVPVTA